jgi:hypothetical protein
MSLLPIDVVGLLEEHLRSDRRPPSGLLRCSSEITGSLRHAQLRLAGAPQKDMTILDYVAMGYGTFWHSKVHAALEAKGVPVVRELNVTPWLPKGWGGVADYLFFDPQHRAWVMADLKTQKGEGFRFLEKDGAKEDHIWQLSAYWHALADAGFELVKGFAVIYLPKNAVAGEDIEPMVFECDPLPREEVFGVMEEKAEAVRKYLKRGGPVVLDGQNVKFINEYLAPPQERIQKMWWQSKTNTWDVKLVPHWSTAYCPYDNTLCDCSEQGTTKIGHWKIERVDEYDKAWYYPRSGYEHIEPELEPSAKEVRKRASGNSR